MQPLDACLPSRHTHRSNTMTCFGLLSEMVASYARVSGSFSLTHSATGRHASSSCQTGKRAGRRHGPECVAVPTKCTGTYSRLQGSDWPPGLALRSATVESTKCGNLNPHHQQQAASGSMQAAAAHLVTILGARKGDGHPKHKRSLHQRCEPPELGFSMASVSCKGVVGALQRQVAPDRTVHTAGSSGQLPGRQTSCSSGHCRAGSCPLVDAHVAARATCSPVSAGKAP